MRYECNTNGKLIWMKISLEKYHKNRKNFNFNLNISKIFLKLVSELDLILNSQPDYQRRASIFCWQYWKHIFFEIKGKNDWVYFNNEQLFNGSNFPKKTITENYYFLEMIVKIFLSLRQVPSHIKYYPKSKMFLICQIFIFHRERDSH